MKRLLPFIAVGAGVACLDAGAQDSSAVAQAAEQLAACVKALDAECVIGLSDVNRYNQLSSPDTDYVQTQARLFESLKENGQRYVRFDVGLPWPGFSARGTTYVFVPYVSELSGLPEVQAYLVGISDNAGTSWKFFDGAHLTPENIQRIIPGYAGQPLPKSNMTHPKPAA